MLLSIENKILWEKKFTLLILLSRTFISKPKSLRRLIYGGFFYVKFPIYPINKIRTGDAPALICLTSKPI